MNIEAIKQQLREGVEKGYWTIEQLDHPSLGFQDCMKVDRRTFPGGFEGVQFRNLLRDSPPVAEKVQVIDDKDLPPMPTGATPAQTPDLPVTLEINYEPIPF